MMIKTDLLAQIPELSVTNLKLVSSSSGGVTVLAGDDVIEGASGYDDDLGASQ
jgi:hypothetical protein